MKSLPILEVHNLRKQYRNKKNIIEAVKGISFEVKKGEIIGLLGPNGAGKSTTIKCISNLILPTEGQVLIKGRDALKNPSFLYRNISAVLEGNRNIYWRLTVRENLKFFAQLQGMRYREFKDYMEELITFFGLGEKINTQARFLSRGMQQKLAVACAFIKRTDILLLDEPTLGLDVESTHDLKRLIKKKARSEGRTIILSSHNMKLVEEVCERVIIINRGEIVAMDRVKSLKKFFSVNSYLFEIEGRLSRETKKKLKDNLLSVRIERKGRRTNRTIEVKEMSRIYDVFEMLKKDGVKIMRIESMEPDFEEIYLKIVKE